MKNTAHPPIGVALAALVFSVFSACASSLIWYKPGSSQEQAAADLQACDYDAAKAAAPLEGAMRGYREVMLQRQCMQTKGYRHISRKRAKREAAAAEMAPK